MANTEISLADNVVPKLKTNFDVAPYYDDYDESKNYERILFKPEVAVQARELNQVQSIIQRQNARIASSIFKEGSRVKGGSFNIDLAANYAKIQDNSSLGDPIILSNFVGQTVTGQTTGVKAVVILIQDGSEASAPNTKTFVFKYTAVAPDNITKAFVPGEELVSGNGFRATIINDVAALGASSLIMIDDGVFFAKGFPVRFARSSIILDAYSNKPTCRVGLAVEEKIVSYIDDTSLLSNAAGEDNYAGPGADRLQLNSSLIRLGLNDTFPEGYIELLVVIDGVIQQQIARTQYNDIMDELARRTYQQSGDFITKGMTLSVREHLDTGKNNGYLNSSNGGDSQKLVIGVSPGEAYVKGYDVQYLVTQYTPIDKAIDYKNVDNVSIQAAYGAFVNAKEVVGSFDIVNGSLVNLYNTAQTRITNKSYVGGGASGSIIGTARVRDVLRISGDNGDADAVYQVYLYDIRMSDADFKSVKAIVSSTGFADIVLESDATARLYDSNFDTAVFPMTANALRSLRDDSNAINNNYIFRKAFSVTIAGNGTFSIATGASDEIFPYAVGALTNLQEDDFSVVLNSAATVALTGTVTVNTGNTTIIGSGTSFSSQLRAQDKVTINGTTHRIASIANNTSLVVTSSPVSSAVANTFVKQYFSGDILPFDVNGTGGSARTITINSSTSASFALSEILDSSKAATVFCKLSKVNSHEKMKILRPSRYVVIDTQTHSANTTGPWSLGVPDVWRINSVRTSANPFSANTDGTDISSSFMLDNGQRASVYDLSHIRKSGSPSLSRYLLVNFDYFAHDFSQGSGFFTINSYPIDDTTTSDPTKIQTGTLPAIISPIDGSVLRLRNCIDFRPAKTATATDSTTIAGASTNPLGDHANLNVPSGGLRFPPVDGSFTSSFSYYLSRRDAISITPRGGVVITRGIPSEQPYTPQIPDGTMLLGAAHVTPYPSTAESVSTIWKGNRVYTMHDVGAIDKRVGALEYYSTLNLLEQATENLKILDSNGLDRFKNGFIVEPCTGSNIADVYNVEYRASIDPINREVRPRFKLNHVNLSYDGNNSSNVVRTGDLVTLPFTHRLFIQQPYASTTRNAAGLEWNWKGTMALIPDTDFWVDTIQNPDVVVDTTGAYDNFSVPQGWQTQWNDWQTVWTGTPVVSNTATRSVSGGTLSAADFARDVNAFSANGGVIQGWFGNNLSQALAWQGSVSLTYATQTRTTTSNQTRTGTQTLVEYVDSNTDIGSVMTDSNLQPYMRSRAIVFYAQGLKPNARMYAFFDSIDVNQYCAPLSGFAISELGMLDLSNTNLMIPGSQLPPSANLQSSIYTATLGGPLLTNANGAIAGVFFLPSTSTRRFTVGTKVFRLTDNLTNADELGLVTTSAEASYTAHGMSVTKENLLITTRTPVVTTRQVSETRTITSTVTSNTLMSVYNPEPIIQAFPIVLPETETAQGVFLTKLDLFFQTKDASLPVTISIVQIDQTTQQVSNILVPLSDVTLYPSQVNVSDNGTVATPVVFRSPICLKRDVTYGVKIFPAGSNPNYKVWIAQLGDNDIATGFRVISQPATGTLYVSANDRSYSAVQDEQLKMNVYVAQFTTGTNGYAALYNTPSELLNLTGDSSSGFVVHGEPIFGQTAMKCNSITGGSPAVGQYVIGGTSGANGSIVTFASNTVSLTNVGKDKKFMIGESLSFYYANGAATGATAVANTISFAHGLEYSMSDYTLQVTDIDLTKNFTIGEQIIGQFNGFKGTVDSFGTIQIDTHQPQITQLVLANTSLIWDAKLTSNTGVQDSAYSRIMVNSNNDLNSQALIYGRNFEVNTLNDHSYKLRGTLYTETPYVSPVIDLSRVGVICVGNIINNDATGETTARGGVAQAKYLTRIATLKDNMDAEDALIYLTGYRPPNTDILVFMKLVNAEDYQELPDHGWIQLEPDGTGNSDITNRNDFLEYTYSLPATSLTGENGAYQYEGANGVTFTGFKNYAIKVVFLSDNSAIVPRFRNLRGVALQR